MKKCNEVKESKKGFVPVNNDVELVMILDRSGSMQGLEKDTIGGFNSTIESQKKGEGNVLVTTVLFDHEMITLHDRLPIDEVKPLTEDDYQPRGTTALLDAVGSMIEHIETIHKYARPEDVPGKTIFVITTDGMENASSRFSVSDVRRLIEQKKEAEGWEFIFLGANIDAVSVAGSMGIEASRSVRYRSDGVGTRMMFASLGKAIHSFRCDESLDTGAWKADVEEDSKKRK